ncbi:hypothetical protein CEE45_05970 [Candidatus Heimdallarchaeota archaeon B3_Heim]|nr:MAG: hypothetical protein CEE45_05970 [Candidatus Heimdallarchaeota archaeon B3_Heim]
MVIKKLIPYEYWKGDLRTMLYYRPEGLYSDMEVPSAAVIDVIDPELDDQSEPIAISEYYTVDLQHLRKFVRNHFNFDVIFLPDLDHHLVKLFGPNKELRQVEPLMPLSRIMYLISPPWRWAAHHAIMLVDEYGRYRNVFRVDNYFIHENRHFLCFYKGRSDIIDFFEQFYDYDDFIKRNRKSLRIYLRTYHKACLSNNKVPESLITEILHGARSRMEGSEEGFGSRVYEMIQYVFKEMDIPFE